MTYNILEVQEGIFRSIEIFKNVEYLDSFTRFINGTSFIWNKKNCFSKSVLLSINLFK